MLKKIKLTCFLSVFSFGINAETWLNDLNCLNYIEKEKCESIYKIGNNLNLSNYHKATFDNQLKKITFLLNKDKEEMAEKKYEYFFKSINNIIKEEQKIELDKEKDNIWNLLKNYSKSNDYTPNPKYKLN